MLIFNKNLFYTLSEMKKGNKDIGMLKFKDSKNFNNQGFKTTREQFSILDSSSKKFKVLRLFRENFKIRWTRDFPVNSEIKTLNLSFKDNSFYISFNISYEDNTSFNPTQSEQARLVRKLIPNDVKSIGMDINIDSIDLGNKDFHKSFNIKDIKTMNLISKNEKKIKRLQRKQARRIIVAKVKKNKLGKNFNKTQAKINKIHTKNHNIKVFALHSLVNQILNFVKANNINHIIMENLDVKQMTRKDNVNKVIGKNRTKSMKKSILHISFHMFKQIMRYKCAINGVYLSLVDPRNTSKTCSRCGNIDNQLNITKRVYECKECGLKMKRDHNSCINMINKFYL